MGVAVEIRRAAALLPGEPVAEGPDPRWQAIIRIAEYVESDPEPVWEFVVRWAAHAQDDLRDAIATCLLEHLLEHHFAEYFPRAEAAALTDPLFADTVRRCWGFGQSTAPGNAERFAALQKRLG